MKPPSALTIVILLVALSACSSSPTEPEPALAIFEHRVPSVVQRGATSELTFSLQAVEATGSWERGGLTISLPGVFDRESLALLEVEGDEVRIIPPSPHGGGFNVIALRGPFAPGDRIRVRMGVRAHSDAATGTHHIQIDGVAFNEVADRQVRELGIVRIPVRVTAS